MHVFLSPGRPLAVRHMRVGIVTYHFVPNYGAVWQAWALQEFLRQLGHDAILVDYRPSHVTNGGRFFFPSNRRQVIMNLTRAYQKYRSFRARFGLRFKASETFRRFEKNRLTRTAGSYATLAELQKEPPQVDALICGSDQIWNPSAQYGLDSAYFLNFGDAHVRRIAYAASFGRSQIEKEYLREIKELTCCFDFISVREPSGVDILRSAGVTMPIAVAVDPTLLLDADAFPVARPTPQQGDGYIWSYMLRSDSVLTKTQRSVSRRLSLPVLAPINLQAGPSWAHLRVPASPEQWLGYIEAATYVMTNSFHGTVFCILKQRPFVVFAMAGAKSALNERVRTLLDYAGLTDRLVDESNSEEALEKLRTPINWEDAAAKLKPLRQQSRAALREVLSCLD